jgi:hypothetical protein
MVKWIQEIPKNKLILGCLSNGWKKKDMGDSHTRELISCFTDLGQYNSTFDLDAPTNYYCRTVFQYNLALDKHYSDGISLCTVGLCDPRYGGLAAPTKTAFSILD